MKTLCSSYPGVFLALQNGGFVPHEWQATDWASASCQWPIQSVWSKPRTSLNVSNIWPLAVGQYHLKLNTCYNQSGVSLCCCDIAPYLLLLVHRVNVETRSLLLLLLSLFLVPFPCLCLSSFCSLTLMMTSHYACYQGQNCLKFSDRNKIRPWDKETYCGDLEEGHLFFSSKMEAFSLLYSHLRPWKQERRNTSLICMWLNLRGHWTPFAWW